MSNEIKGFEIHAISYEEAKKRLPEYTYGIVHMMSDLKYDRLDKISVNWEELIELRAFSEQGALHIYKGNDGWMAQCCSETGEEIPDTIVIKYEMRDGRKLMVKEYLVPDEEDGQAEVRYTRPFAMI